LRVISSGLDSGVPVIVEGLQMIRPGIPVKTDVAVLPRQVRKEAKVAAGRRSGRTRDISPGGSTARIDRTASSSEATPGT
jgi:hypothetical protein